MELIKHDVNTVLSKLNKCEEQINGSILQSGTPTRDQRILKWIAEFRSDDWINQQARKEGWHVKGELIRLRHDPIYQPQIRAYREQYNREYWQDPAYSERYICDLLIRGAEQAIKQGKHTGAAALIRELKDIRGLKKADDLEVVHTYQGSATIEGKIEHAITTKQAPPLGLSDSVNDQVIDVLASQAEPALIPKPPEPTYQ